MTIRLVMLGDIVGTAGRLAVTQCLPAIRERYQPNVVIANAENTANGSGLTPTLYQKLCDAGVDAMTLGDHAYRKRQIVRTLEEKSNITRPANFPTGAKGRRWMRIELSNAPGKPNLYVITLLGRLYTTLPVDEPFSVIDELLAALPEKNPLVLVEVHAEATSEKQAMGWYLNGRVIAVVGTHTHVPTADARILPPTAPGNGHDVAQGPGTTGYITDLGMCGPHDSVIGRQIDPVLAYLTSAFPVPFDVAQGDPRVNGVCIEIDPQARKAVAIERIQICADPTAPPFVA